MASLQELRGSIASVQATRKITSAMKMVAAAKMRKDQRLMDPSLFDFYHEMIEGPNKREWVFWDTRNIAFSQELGRNAGFEIAYDWQKLDSRPPP